MRISINLASRPFNDLGPILRQLRITMGVLVGLCLALWFGLHLVHNAAEKARARDHSLDGQLAKLNTEQQTYQNLMHQPANALVLTQAQSLNQLFEEKSFSWTLAMEDLETVLPGGVQVTTLEPERAKDGHITLKLHVLGPRDHAVELVRNLERSKRFLLPRIVGENSEMNSGPGQRVEAISASSPVNFDLLAEYNPPTTEERKLLAARRHEKAMAEVLAPLVTAKPIAPRPVAPQPLAAPRPQNMPAAQNRQPMPMQNQFPLPGPQNTPGPQNMPYNGPNNRPNQPPPNQGGPR